MTKPPPIQWVTAAPLWPTASTQPLTMQRPALLRFKGDSFMDDLIAMLTNAPGQLGTQVAQPESSAVPPVGADPGWSPLPKDAPLKLFQPAHGYFYLVAASLVCRQAGLPDHVVNAGRGEKVQFVLRLYDPSIKDISKREFAWVTQTDGTRAWQPGAPAQLVADGEELLPLFPVRFKDGDRTRSLFVGLVPTSSRETYQAAPMLDPAATQGEDGRVEEFLLRVSGALQALHATQPLPSQQSTPQQNSALEDLTLAQEQLASMFLLLDFADFLKNQQIDVTGDTPPGAGDLRSDLYTLLTSATVDGATTWVQALRDAWDQRHAINGEQPGATIDPNYNLKNDYAAALDLTALKNAVVKALGAYTLPPTPPAPVWQPKIDPAGGALYVLRCVYGRPTCRPPHADVVSPPTLPFALAQFFDPDAPSRPIRIPLPVDTSIAGLRKFAKNVAFLTSKTLRNQVGGVTNLKNLSNGLVSGGDKFGLGEICSFSLPIITICAMIVLIIFVILLNIAFWWMPFFRICFPIPEKE